MFTSLLISQTFNVPIYFQTGLGLGYDSNFLKLSDSDEINVSILPEILGDSKSFDSGIIKPSMRVEYSPVLLENIESVFKFSASTSLYSSSNQKSYSSFSGELGFKFKTYQWLKLGGFSIPKYYIRPYKDVDIDDGVYYPASFSNSGWFVSYSNPLTNKSWVKIKLNYSEQYYLENPSHFTEYDTQVSSVSLTYNHKFNNDKISITGKTGIGDNISFNDPQVPTSTLVDRSYVFDKIKVSWTNYKGWESIISKWGTSIQLNQRLYELNSDEINDLDWKYYLETQIQLWAKYSFNNIDVKVEYRYRQRFSEVADGGEFEWVENTKQYQKHELWLSFTLQSVLDLAY